MSIVGQMIVAALIILLIWRGREDWSKFGLCRPRVLWDLLAAGILYLVTVRIMYVSNDIFDDVLRNWLHSDEIYRLTQNSLEWAPPHGGIDLAIALVTSLCIGFSEELAFRGYLIPRLKQIFNYAWVGVILSAVLFSTIHTYQGVDGVWNAFVIGVVFGVVFVYFRRLWPLAITHALMDFVAMLWHGAQI
jgi:membrane protease YdiL (CAAX protease family)